uniref:hypothetical protein RF1 n=1 Tax=Gentiana rubicunda TaxID=553057 RepID=UPI001EE03B7B|nr:hypothetical protein RF1 [Gentiana rubicunda]UIB41605.1 hypothetical protein RF1 [Gentiana rubicunda]
MIFQYFLLGNIVSLCMKIINSVVVVGLYYGFLATFYIGPSYLFLLRAQVMEEVTAKRVSATTGFITGQLMMFISIYYAPLHQALGRPHTITVLALPYILFHFFWNNHKNFFYYGPTTRNLIRKFSIQCVFLTNLIFQLFNYCILPSSMVARLVNIYMFRCNNKILFVTSSFVGWLIVHIFFMKWLGLILVWIRQNNSIRSNKYLVSKLRNSMARIFTILLFITCIYYLDRIPLPILTNKLNKLKQTSKTKEGVESKKKRDLGIEKTSEIKGTKQVHKKSTEEDPSSSLFSKLNQLNKKGGKNKKKEQKNGYILFRLGVEDFSKSLVTLLFDHNRWNRPFRYIKKKRSEGSVRNEMAQYFFDIPKNKTNVKKKVSFTYSPSLFIFLERITKRFLLTLTKISFFYTHYLYPKNQKSNNKSIEFQTRIETLEKEVTFLDILETRIRLCTDGTRNDYFSKMYDPLLNSSYCLNIKKKVPKNLKTYKENLRETVGINQIHNILFTYSDSEKFKLKKDEALYNNNKKFSISSNNLLTDEFDTKILQNLNLNPCLLSDQEGVKKDFEKCSFFFKIFFKTVRNHPNLKKKSSGLKEIRKRVPRRSYELITEFQQKSGQYPNRRGQIRSRKTRFIVILNPIKQKTINNSNKDTKKNKDANIKDLRKQIFLVRYYQQSDFRRGIIKGSIRAQRRKICMWEPFQANVHSPLFLDIIKKSPRFSFDRSGLIQAIFQNWIHNRIDFKFFENMDEEKKKEHKKETHKTDKKEENKRQEQIRADIAEAWNSISTARKARSLLLIAQSKLRKYILLPSFIIAKNIGRMVLLQIPEWFEDLQEWNRELHIICTYNGIQLSETEFPKNWLREGMQIKILFPFCLKPWRRSKLRPYYMQNKKENNSFCFLTVWGLETNLPFGSARQRSSFFKPIFKKLKTKIKKSKNSFLKKTKIRVFSKFNPILFFNASKVYKSNQIKNNKYSTTINEIIPESLINQIQSSNQILTEKKNKDITARAITIRNQIEIMTKDNKKNTRLYISDNKRIYKIYKDKRLEFSNYFFEIIKRRNIQLISKIHFFINFFLERIYINPLLSIINLSKPIRQLFLDSINKFIKKFININEADEEIINKKREKKIHFISIIKKLKNSQKGYYLSYLSQAYVFYNLSQIQGSNLNKLRYVFKYHDYGIPLFVKTQKKIKDSFEGVIYLELNHNKSFNYETNHWKTWVKKLNRYHQYNSYNSKASRKKISQHPRVQNCKKDLYEKDILILFKKENPVETYFVQNKKDNLKKNSRYDLISYQSSNSENKRDSFIYGSIFETQVNRKQDSYSNTNTKKCNFFNIWERSPIINYIRKSERKSTKKTPDRKYFDWKTLHFDLRQKIAIEYWIKIDTKSNQNTNIKTNNYQLTDKIVKKSLFYLALTKKLKIKVPNPPQNLLDWMGMNEKIRKCLMSTLNFHFWFFPEFLILSNLYKMKPWVIPSKRLLLRKGIEKGYVGSKVMRKEKKKQYKNKAETELKFLMKRYLLFQFRWDDTLNQRIINNIKIFCLLIRLLNSRKIVISSIQQREMTLDRLLIQNSLNIVELIKKGILVIEPVRLSVKKDSQFILYQTLCISLVHKSKHKNNQGYPEQTDIDNNFIDLLAPETILPHKSRREFRMKISFNYKNTNKNLGFCITNNCSQFVDRQKHKEKNELIKIQFLTCSNCQLEDLACINRYWFDTTNGSRFSMLRIYMYSELKYCW